MSATWTKVQVYSNWCHTDYLEKKDDKPVPFKPGDYYVRFPDGHEGMYRLKVRKWSETINDHGHPYDVPYSEIFLLEKVHGITVVVPLGKKGIEVRV
jgi:hypothetical protein